MTAKSAKKPEPTPWGDNISLTYRDLDGMEAARSMACRWTVSSSRGLIAMCCDEDAARAFALAIGGSVEAKPEPVVENIDRRQLSLLGGKVA